MMTSPVTMFNASVMSEGGEGGVGMDLADVCLDMMARYTYSNLSTLPSRSSGADFLLSGGPSKTWVVANSLVTITTSGQGGGRTGICKRCAALRTNLSEPEVFPSEVRSDTLCSCWCKGWAEIKIRRPTGNISWLMRLQNRLHPLSLTNPASLSVPESDLGLLSTNLVLQGADVSKNGYSDEAVEDRSRKMYNNSRHEDGLDETVVDPSRGDDSTPELLEPVEEEDNDQSTDNDVTPHRVAPVLVNEESSDWVTPEVPLHDREQPEEVNTTENEAAIKQEPEGHAITLQSLVENESASTSVPHKGIPSHTDSETTQAPIPNQAHHSSQSWSGKGQMSRLPLSPRASSCSKLFSLEHLPPLPAYDEDGYGRSPSLHEEAKILSEEEQVREIVTNDVYQYSCLLQIKLHV